MSADPNTERPAQITAHRACCGTEHDPASGKIHGYCIVCGVPWPCEYAGTPPTLIDTPKTDMKEFKDGSIATAPNGNQWKRQEKPGYDFDGSLYHWRPRMEVVNESYPWLTDLMVERLGLVVTEPQAPRIVESWVTDDFEMAGPFPQWEGRATTIVLSEDVLETIKCHKEGDGYVYPGTRGQSLGYVLGQLPGDNFTVLVLKGGS